MKEIKFLIDMGYAGCVREVTETFPDNVTEEELEEYGEQLVWEYVHVSYHEV